MNILKILLVLFITGGFAVNTANSQAVVIKNGDVQILYTDDGVYESVSAQMVVTPEGNLLIKITWILDPEDSWVPEHGVYKRVVHGEIWWDGVLYELADEVIVKPDGTLMLVAHGNPGKDK